MIKLLLFCLNRTKPTYLLLFFTFIVATVSAKVNETIVEKDSIAPSQESVITIKGNTIFYISDSTSLSTIKIKRINDTIFSKKEKISKKYVSKPPIHQTKIKQAKHTHSPPIVYIPKKLFYLPYTPSTQFYTYKPKTIGIFYDNYSNQATLFNDCINNIYIFDITYKESFYTYIFCDYSICLSHLEIRSPSYLI